MNTFLWILQAFAALAFLYSGISKILFSEQKLVSMGQTGVEGLPLWFIRFIGMTEMFGGAGLLLPWWLSVYIILTPVAAICLAIIMPFAAIIHFKRKEFASVFFNILLFFICSFIAIARLSELNGESF